MLTYLLLLAQSDLNTTASQSVDIMPFWAKLLVGPLALTAGLVIWTFYTETQRIPKLVGLLREEQKENDGLRDKCNEEKERLRAHYEDREYKLRIAYRKCRDKYTKERSARAWWQSQAANFANQLGTKANIPRDIDGTSYGALDDENSTDEEDNDFF